MIFPPIDKMIEKVGCKFALVTLVSKRTHEVEQKTPESLEESGLTPITYAALDVYEGRVFAKKPE